MATLVSFTQSHLRAGLGARASRGEGMTSDRRAPLLPVSAAFVHCMVDTVVPVVRQLRLRRTDGLRLPETFGRAGGGVRVSPAGLRVWSSERWTRPVSALLDLGRPASRGKETPGLAQRGPSLAPRTLMRSRAVLGVLTSYYRWVGRPPAGLQ